jgi:hypothetical protein
MATASRFHPVFAMLISGALAVLFGGRLWGGDDPTAGVVPGEIRVHIPPELPCGIRTMTGAENQIYLLGKCGAVVRWDPFSGESSVLVLDDQVDEAFAIAVAHDRIAVLTDRRRAIRIYDRDGRFLSEYHYSGETHLERIALTAQGVLASSFFDDHLFSFLGTIILSLFGSLRIYTIGRT